MKKQAKLKVRQLNYLTDYDDVCRWWQAWGFPALPLDFLPGTAFIAEYQGKKIAAAFLYRDSSCGFGCLDWFVTDKNADRRQAIFAVDKIIEEGIQIAKQLGVKFLYNSVENRVILNRLIRAGFEIKEINRANVVKFIG